MRGLRLAAGFLTALDVRPSRRMESGDLGAAAAWFPLIGAFIGAVLWLLQRLLTPHLPALPTAALLVAVWVAATGALHLDGLADCCDSFFASVTADRRLEIMRDSRSGAFGVVGVALILLLKVSTVASLTNPLGLLLAPVLGRWWMLPLARLRPAREGGLGARLRAELGWRAFLGAGLVVLMVVGLAGPRGRVALLATGLGTATVGQLARSRIGGQTGDVLGANCEFVEWIALLTYAWV